MSFLFHRTFKSIIQIQNTKQKSDNSDWTFFTFGLLYLEPHKVSDYFVDYWIPKFLTDDRVIKYCNYLINNKINS